LCVDELIVNQVAARAGRCRLCEARALEEAQALEPLPALFPRQQVRRVRESRTEPRGLVALASLARALRPQSPPIEARRARPAGAPARRVVAADRAATGAAERPWWLGSLAPEGRRLLLFVGKGGVGKTSTAAAVA